MKLSQNKKEIVIIAVAWTLILASAPLYMYYAHISSDTPFDWGEPLDTLTYLTAFLVLFLVNHFILIPELIGTKRIGLYASCAVVMLTLFMIFLNIKSHGQRPMRLNTTEHRDMRPGPALPEYAPEQRRQWMPGHERYIYRPHRIAPPDLARMIIALLMIGADLGVAAWINEEKMRKRLMLLEQQSLKQELQHLRYQINPHFFMNTLNNIHVLVDLDQERAKRAIVELSGLMRYALYEGNSNLAPLGHEVEFIRVYISLMKLRFNDKVEVTCQTPDTIPAEALMPPMLLATFVENAFKHGVSYKAPSFIKVEIGIEPDRQMRFCCTNSRHASATQDGHHGIGLENVRKRLELQYADRYTLDIDESDSNVFAVRLTLPIYPDIQQ